MRIDRFMTGLISLIVLLWGIGLFVLAFAWSVPAVSDLTLVEGHLSVYQIKHSRNRFGGQSKTSPTVLFQTKEGGKFYNEALTEKTARQVFTSPGTALRFYIETASKRTLSGGERATYGLWVDGVKVQDVQVAVEQERFVVRVVFPSLGLLLVGLAVFFFRWRNPFDSRRPSKRSLEPRKPRSRPGPSRV